MKNKPKNIPTYYKFPGTPVYRDTTALPFKNGGNTFPSLYSTPNFYANGGDLGKKKKKKKEDELTYKYYKHPSAPGRMFAQDNLGRWTEIVDRVHRKINYDPDYYLTPNVKEMTKEERQQALYEGSEYNPRELKEINIKGPIWKMQEYQREYENMYSKDAYMDRRINGYLNSNKGLNRALGQVSKESVPQKVIDKFAAAYNHNKNTYATERYLRDYLGADPDKRGQWVDKVSDPSTPEGRHILKTIANSEYGYKLEPNLFARFVGGVTEALNWINPINAAQNIYEYATGTDYDNPTEIGNVLPDYLSEKEFEEVTPLDVLAPLEYIPRVALNSTIEALNPNTNVSWNTISGYRNPEIRDKDEAVANMVMGFTTGMVDLPGALTSAGKFIKGVNQGAEALAQNTVNLFKTGASNVDEIRDMSAAINAANAATTANAANAARTTATNVDNAKLLNTGSQGLLNVGEEVTGINKILQDKELRKIVVDEHPWNAKNLLSTEGEIIPESASWTTIMDDAKAKLNQFDLTKPLADADYIKAADAINPEISKVASLEEIKGLHQDALNYFQGQGTPEDIALYIREGLAEKLPSIGEAPTIVEGYPTYTSGFSVSNSLDPDAPQYFGPKSVYNKALELGYDINNLTPQQQNILAAYTKLYDVPINKLLRQGFDAVPGIRGEFYAERAQTLLDAVLANKFGKETSVTRSIKHNFPLDLVKKEDFTPTGNTKYIGNLKEGDVFQNKGFLSTSLNPNVRWGKPRYSQRILIPGEGVQSFGFPNAAKASSSPFEMEAVLPPNLVTEVVHVLDPKTADALGYKYVTRILNPYLAPAAIGTTAGLSLLNNSPNQNNYGASFNMPNAYEQMSLNTDSKAYGGPLNDRNINGKLLQSTYASPLGNMFREGGPFGENKGTFDYANSIYASQLGNYYGNGGFTVTRSNDRKGKTHKVVRNSDGKTEYYGSEMKNQPKNEKVKAAAEARHSAQGNFKNPFFKAYWDATWKYGGNINKNIIPLLSYRTGGQFPRPYSLPEDSFKQGGRNLHNSVYASSNAQYPAIYKLGGNINVVAGGEKHRVYKKESPTGVGEGVKGHIMVNHPTMDKGQWDTIDLTAKSGAKTVAEGIAATKKWHRENPNVYRQGGSVLSMSNTPQLQGEGKDLTIPENAYIYAGGGLIKRADGSYSQRGLWDNIRAAAERNKTMGKPGKQPTKQMLQQEKKINKNK